MQVYDEHCFVYTLNAHLRTFARHLYGAPCVFPPNFLGNHMCWGGGGGGGRGGGGGGRSSFFMSSVK